MKICRENQPIIHGVFRRAAFLAGIVLCCAAAALVLIRGIRAAAPVQAPELYEIQVTGAPVRIDLNTADKDTLCLLPGIGETKAQAILDRREENGPFTDPSQLTEVYGIGEATLEKLEPYVTCSPQTP